MNILSNSTVVQLVGALSQGPKGHEFNSWSGHVPRLWVWSQLRAHRRKQLIDISLSHWCFFPSPTPSLSQRNEKKMSSGEEKNIISNNVSDMFMNKLVAIRISFTLPKVTDKVECRSVLTTLAPFFILIISS